MCLDPMAQYRTCALVRIREERTCRVRQPFLCLLERSFSLNTYHTGGITRYQNDRSGPEASDCGRRVRGWVMLRVVQVRVVVHLVGLTGPLFGISLRLLAAGVY